MTTSDIVFTPHSIKRFQERCRPALDAPAASLELQRLLASGRIVATAPDWHACRTASTASLYLLLGDDLVLPLEPDRRSADRWVAKTCITRGGLSDAVRVRRNERKRNSRRARRARRRRERHSGPRELPVPELAP